MKRNIGKPDINSSNNNPIIPISLKEGWRYAVPIPLIFPGSNIFSESVFQADRITF